MQDYTKLKVWQKGHEFALAVYECTASFPPDERFGLTSQLRRCAVSIPSNIAEGAGRSSSAEFRRFLHIAVGSSNEASYQLLLARDLGFHAAERYEALRLAAEEIRRMLAALIARTAGDPADAT